MISSSSHIIRVAEGPERAPSRARREMGPEERKRKARCLPKIDNKKMFCAHFTRMQIFFCLERVRGICWVVWFYLDKSEITCFCRLKRWRCLIENRSFSILPIETISFLTYLDESINFDTSLEVKTTSSFEAVLKLGFLLLEVEGEKYFLRGDMRDLCSQGRR